MRESTAHRPDMKDLYVARQPIFDAQQRIQAYELLYRRSGEAEEAGSGSPESLSSTVIVGAILGMGLDRLTEGRTAFINVAEQVLLSGVGEILDPRSVVVELLESVRPTDEVVEATRRLKAAGFRIALDDFILEPERHRLLELADIVKVDVLAAAEHLEETVALLSPYPVRLLAEKVESAEVHDRCAALGFEYFQGFHYYRPETLSKRDLRTGMAAVARLLAMVGDLGVTDREIEDAFRSDPSLTYKLLRIVNAAALGGRGVESIGHAMRLAGREPVHRWLSLLLLTSVRGGGEIRLEMIKSALLRGRMCELLGDGARCSARRDIPSGGALFLVGLFSHLDHLLGMEMADILDDLDVTPEVRDALLQRRGPAGTLLAGVTAYTEGSWDGAEQALARVGVASETIGDAFLEAVTWAGAQLALHQGS